MRRQRMAAHLSIAVKALDGDRVPSGQRNSPRRGDTNPGGGGQRHRGVFDQRRVHVIAGLGKFDQPLRALDLNQGLGPRAAQRHAGRNQAALRGRHRLARQNPANQRGNGAHVAQIRQRPQPPGTVTFAGDGHAQRAKTLIARVKQVVQQRQARRLVQHANHALAPAIRAGVIDSACSRVFACGQKLHVAQRQVFAERKAALQPARRVTQ